MAIIGAGAKEAVGPPMSDDGRLARGVLNDVDIAALTLSDMAPAMSFFFSSATTVSTPLAAHTSWSLSCVWRSNRLRGAIGNVTARMAVIGRSGGSLLVSVLRHHLEAYALADGLAWT